jgi:hypothetical protein
LLLITNTAFAANERTVGVYVALCDNEHQGIVPVPKAVGNGDDPSRNLYWGSADGLCNVFSKSPHWKKEAAVQSESGNLNIMQTLTYRHSSENVTLTAFAYRGSAIKTCLEDFEKAIHDGKYDLVVYIGHNGLMDFSLPLPDGQSDRKKKPECIVLCCKSGSHFGERIEQMGAAPILLTTQFMYPGSFLQHDVLEEWVKSSGVAKYRAAAGHAYASNQNISTKAAMGIFTDLSGSGK